MSESDEKRFRDYFLRVFGSRLRKTEKSVLNIFERFFTHHDRAAVNVRLLVDRCRSFLHFLLGRSEQRSGGRRLQMPFASSCLHFLALIAGEKKSNEQIRQLDRYLVTRGGRENHGRTKERSHYRLWLIQQLASLPSSRLVSSVDFLLTNDCHCRSDRIRKRTTMSRGHDETVTVGRSGITRRRIESRQLL